MCVWGGGEGGAGARRRMGMDGVKGEGRWVLLAEQVGGKVNHTHARRRALADVMGSELG